ncbi:hypothetical protein N5079_18015 [Planotetraspora sp. A-T 1434]|uniref:hypothetical protein n=1 Tax=Planotetraspora sp. A-T 1434 TaxID=2979219 RepID=UPI0021BF4D82|nr:hypothetical protein [Planotetraspora sp. A-T 1434]MCT9932102.1 hypothetical protein [Planotetraspora sp. A-T 1434]
MSTTSRSIRGRYVALAAVTIGVSWLATGQAMAGAAATMTTTCEPQNKSAAALHSLAPATGVLSITDAAGAAAGQGVPALPGRPGAVPPAARLIPAAQPKAVPAAVPAGVPAAPKGVLPAPKLPAVPLLAVAPARPNLSSPACVPAAPVVTEPIAEKPRHKHPRKHHKPAAQPKVANGAQQRTQSQPPANGEAFVPLPHHGKRHHKHPVRQGARQGGRHAHRHHDAPVTSAAPAAQATPAAPAAPATPAAGPRAAHREGRVHPKAAAPVPTAGDIADISKLLP